MDGTELNTSCDCYVFEPFVDFNKIPINKQDLTLLNMKISSLLAHVFNSLNHFNINCISENRLSTKSSLTTNINNPDYNIENAPTESSAEGTLMYI